MRRVVFFMMTTANGLYERGRWDQTENGIDWHNTDAEFDTFAAEQLDEFSMHLYGRVTYEGMATFWPTPEGIAADPEVARRMNATPKVVFSKTLDRAEWENSTLVKGDAAQEVASLKQQPGGDMMIMGSSDLVASLAGAGLIDEYRIMVNPVLIGTGKPMLSGLARDVPLTLLRTRTFKNGNVLLCYGPASAPSVAA
jgi:dihydrofolate reductase